MKDAQDPRRLIDGQSVYQDRPLYSAANWIISKSLIAIGLPNRSIPVVGNSGSVTIYSEIFYVGFLSLNFVTLSTAVLLTIKSFKNRFNEPKFGVLPFLIIFNLIFLMSANELTKTFFWTPHSQMFNLLLPGFAAYLFTAKEKLLNKKFLILVSATIGVLLFCYSLLVLLFLVVILVDKTQWKNRLRLSFLFSLPYLIWPLIIRASGGHYININIVRFKEYVWIYYAAKSGHLPQQLFSNELSFIKTLPVIPLLGLSIAFIFWLYKNKGVASIHRLFLDVRIVFFVIYIGVYSLMGYYARRVALGPILFAEILAFGYMLGCSMKLTLSRKKFVLGSLLGMQFLFWILTHGPMQ